MWSLVKKEARQIVRDPSSIAIGIVLPLVLILLEKKFPSQKAPKKKGDAKAAEGA